MEEQKRVFMMNLRRLLNEMQTKKGPLMCANIINDPAPEVLRTAEKEHKKNRPPCKGVSPAENRKKRTKL